MEKLALSLGIENYLSTLDKYYVDKTSIIKDILYQGKGSTILITRPRRFGKTLTLSMVEYFFTNEGDYRYAFKGKNIEREQSICETYQNKVPVIHLNMKDVVREDISSLLSSLADQMSLLYRGYTYLLESPNLLEIEKSEFLDILNKKANQTLLIGSLRRLIDFLYKHYETKVILLLDEYDSPIEKAYENGFYAESMALLKPFYSNALKGNSSLLFALVTGVLQLSKESLFSGLNNLLVSSVNDYFLHPYFGFTKKEVNAIASYYDSSFEEGEITEWYGGYNKVNGEEIYNPWSIMSLFLNRSLDTYWANTGSNDLLRAIFSSYPVEERLLSLVGETYSTLQFVKETNYRIFRDNDDSLVAFLVQTGYLTFEKAGDGYRLCFPNKEIKMLFSNEILAPSLLRPTLNKSVLIRKAIEEGDEKKVEIALKDYVLSSFSYYDLTKEKDYQNLLTGILSVLFDTHSIKSEVNAGEGRCDIALSPKEGSNVGYLLEVKVSFAKKEPSQLNLSKMADSALGQIIEKDYAENMRLNGVKIIHCYGMAFYRKKCAIVHRLLDLHS